jgi:transposase
LSPLRGKHTTTPEHMPASHRAHLQWTPQKLIDWGLRIGVSTAAMVTWQLEHRPHPEQGYRACLGMQRLARQFTRRGWRRPAPGRWRFVHPPTAA